MIGSYAKKAVGTFGSDSFKTEGYYGQDKRIK